MSRMTRRSRLGAHFEPLEDRCNPSQFGLPWPDANHLTLSFVPDGTPTPTGPSNLTATLGAIPNWKTEVLRAYQTWAANTNIDIKLVPDSGAPLGTPGAVQGDPRFGDIRVAASAGVGSGEVAFSSPFSWTGSTFAGDLVFDSNYTFGVGATAGVSDLFTVAAHEAGHAFGLDHSTEFGSVLNPTYTYKTGLSSGDVARIQAMYGAPVADADSAARPTTLVTTNNPNQRAAEGRLNVAGDADYYKIDVPSGTQSLVGRFDGSGESLVTAKATITNIFGEVKGVVQATDPTSNDFTFSWVNPVPSTYFIKVEGSRGDVFDRGAYDFVVDLTTKKDPKVAPLPKVAGPVSDNHTNDDLGHVTVIDPKTQTDARFDATYQGVIDNATDLDFYKVRSAKYADNSLGNMNVIVWGTGNGATPLVTPAVHVFDDQKHAVAYQLVANDRGVVSVFVPNVNSDKDYFVEVQARSQAAGTNLGNYFLGVDFNQTAAVPLSGLASNLVATGGTDLGTLAVNQAGIYQFQLGATSSGTGSTNTAVALDVVDALGQTVFSVTAGPSQPLTTMQYLAAGTYTARYRQVALATGASATVQYSAYISALSDPIGTVRSTTTTTVAPTTYTGSATTTTPTGYMYF